MGKNDNRENLGTRKIAGSINLPVGVNLANAIFEGNFDIGIPPYELDKAAKIIKDFLDDDEYRWLCMSFGIGCERMLNKDVAKKIGMDQNAYSKRLKRIVEKLQCPECCNQLAKLIPTRDEVYSALNMSKKRSVANGRVRELEGEKVRLENEKASLKNENTRLKNELKTEKERSARASKSRVSVDMSAQVKQLSDENAKAKRELAGVKTENGNLKKQVEVAEKKSAEFDKNLQLQKDKTKRAEERADNGYRRVEFLEGNIRLLVKTSAEKDEAIKELTARADAAEALALEYKSMLDTLLNTPIGELIGGLEEQSSADSECTETPDDVARDNNRQELTMQTVFSGVGYLIEALNRVGITDLEELLKKSPADLAKLGLSKKQVAKIKKHLGDHRLCLRGCSAA